MKRQCWNGANRGRHWYPRRSDERQSSRTIGWLPGQHKIRMMGGELIVNEYVRDERYQAQQMDVVWGRTLSEGALTTQPLLPTYK